MKKILFIITTIILAVAYANLPPTQLKGGNESKLSTTFNFNLGQIPVSRTGTTVTFGTIPVTQGGTSSTSLTQYSLMSGNGTDAVNMIAPAASGTILFSTGAASFPTFRSLTGNDVSTALGYIPAVSGSPWATNGTSIYYNDGNVGVGTSSPVSSNGKSFHVYNDLDDGTVNSNSTLIVQSLNRNANFVSIASGTGNSTGSIIFRHDDIANSSDEGSITYNHTSKAMTFKTSGTEVVRVTSGGAVGIGTTSPSDPLHVQGTGTFGTRYQARVSDGTRMLRFGANSTATEIQSQGSVPLFINGSGSNNLILNSSGGNVGIGTSNPTTVLSVSGTITMQKANSTVYVASSTAAASPYSNGTVLIVNNTASVDNSASYLALGTTVSDSTARAAYVGMVDGAAGGGNWGNLVFGGRSGSSSYNERMRINIGNGAVGIGTTAPTAALDVHSSSNPIVQVNNIGSYSSTVGGAVIQLMATSSTAVVSGSRLGAMQFAGTSQSGTTVAGAYIRSNAIGDWSPTSQGADLTFGVTASGSTTRSVALHIQSTTAASFAGQIRAPSLQVSGLSSGVLSTDSSGNVSSSLGTSGQVLLSNGSSTYWGTNTATPSFTPQYVTSTTTVTTATHVLASASSGPYTITLPSASSTGTLITLTKLDATSHVITLSTQFGQTVESSATSRLNTIGESAAFISSGGTFVQVHRTFKGTPLGSGTITIGATSVAPTKGAGDYDNVYAERVNGSQAKVFYKFRQGVAGANGTGDYLFTLPFGLRFDPRKNYFSTSTNVYDTILQGSYIGSGHIGNGSNSGICRAAAYDATRFRLACINSFTQYQWFGSGFFALGGGSIGFSVVLENVDVENWLE